MIPDYALYGKKLLDIGTEKMQAFERSVNLRVDDACRRMKLRRDQLQVICFASAEKESFAVREGDVIRIYMDKHQMDHLYMLTFLYYLHGQVDIKNRIYLALTQQFPYFEKRICTVLLLIQAEKCFNRKELFQAKRYLDALSKFDSRDDLQNLRQIDPDKCAFISNLIVLKGMRQDACFAFSLNFFVFHEIAHAKYTLSHESLCDFGLAVEAALDIFGGEFDEIYEEYGEIKPDIPFEEYICDTYALYLLFDFVFSQSQRYEQELVIESYFISVLNLALVSSRTGDQELMEGERYQYASYRAVHVIYAVMLLWSMEGRPWKDIEAIQGSTIYAFKKYKNLKESLDNNWSTLYNRFHANSDETLGRQEEKKLIDELYDRFSKID